MFQERLQWEIQQMNRRERETAEENFRKWLIYTFKEIRENFATIKQEQNAMQRRVFRKRK